MTPETLKALKGSVRKWKRIAEGIGEDHGQHNCPLCVMFLYNKAGDHCTGCPVRNETGLRHCKGSPYVDWNTEIGAREYRFRRDVYKAETLKLRALARREAKFLKSLMPKETRP